MLPIPPGVYHRLGHRRQCPLRKLSSTKKRARRMSLVGTKRPVGVALHETAPETQEPFVVRMPALLTTLIADIADDIVRRDRVAFVPRVEELKNSY